MGVKQGVQGWVAKHVKHPWEPGRVAEEARQSLTRPIVATGWAPRELVSQVAEGSQGDRVTLFARHAGHSVASVTVEVQDPPYYDEAFARKQAALASAGGAYQSVEFTPSLPDGITEPATFEGQVFPKLGIARAIGFLLDMQPFVIRGYADPTM